ncbi:hypothetical protein ACOME3_003516 [Neoechinorhynchus agilis]
MSWINRVCQDLLQENKLLLKLKRFEAVVIFFGASINLERIREFALSIEAVRENEETRLIEKLTNEGQSEMTRNVLIEYCSNVSQSVALKVVDIATFVSAVPECCSHQSIITSSDIRRNGKFPSVSYVHKRNSVILFRCDSIADDYSGKQNDYELFRSLSMGQTCKGKIFSVCHKIPLGTSIKLTVGWDKIKPVIESNYLRYFDGFRISRSIFENRLDIRF